MNEPDTAPVAEATDRRAWEPLGFEKIAAADAESAGISTNLDSATNYS